MSDDGRLAYWPEAYEDELLYSMVARYARHTGIRSALVLWRELFDGDNHRPTFDLPNGVGRLAAKLPEGAGLTPSRLIRRHTLFPYYRAVGSLDRARKIMRGMVVDDRRTDGMQRLSLRIPRTTILRFCPQCDHEAVTRHGEPYWRRELQLPGVLMCPTHGTILKASGVVVNHTTGRRYEPATHTTNGRLAPDVVGPLSSDQTAVLLTLAGKSAEILRRGRWEGADDRIWRRRFREACGRKGVDLITKDHGHAERLKLERAATDTVGFLSTVWPRLLRSTATRGWIKSVDAIGGEQRDPVLRILAELVVERIPDRTDPFGPGPWPCLNPLSGHFRELVVKSVSMRRSLGGERPMIGTFECACGYVYSRGIGPDGEAKPPRLIDYGPSLAKLIDETLASGRSVTSAARDAGLNKASLKQLASKLGYNDWPRRGGRRKSSSP